MTLVAALAALITGLLAPTVTQAETPSITAQAAAVEARYPSVHFATSADAVEYGPYLDALNPNGVPPPDPSDQYTVAQYKAHLMGYTLGPNAWTDNGMIRILGWTTGGRGYVRVRSAATCPPCSTVAADPMTRSTGTVSGVLVDPEGVNPDGLPGWANPVSWHWSNILGAVWDGIWNGCIKGSLSGVISTAGATVAANLAMRGGQVFLGPYGYAAIAITGCAVGVINH